MSVFHRRTARTAILLTTKALAVSSAVLSSSTAHASRSDRDDDGMPNRWEVTHGLNPDRANARGDKDDDGTRDGDEDSDDDDIDNEDEDDADESCSDDDDDRDEDNISDEDENDYGFRAGDDDDDDDGTPDGEEDSDEDGQSNEDDDDSDDDSCSDDSEDTDDLLGPIVSFDAKTGDLVINSLRSGLLTFVVTDDTEIEFDSSGHGSGEEGSTEDLVPDAVVIEVDLEDDGTLEEVELERP